MTTGKLGRSLAILALALLACCPAGAVTLSTLRSDARLLADDNGTTRFRFTDAQVNSLLNEGQKTAIARSWCVHKSYSFDLVSGTTYYSLPADYVAMKRLTSDWLDLPEMSVAALAGKNRSWEESSGTPSFYFVNFASRTKVGFAPFPDTTSDTTTVRMDYFASITDMASDSDDAFNDIVELQPYAHMLPYFAAFRMAIIDGRTGVAEAFLAQYELLLKSMMERCFERPSYNPSATGQMR